MPPPTVLIVDDDPGARDLAQLALESVHGWNVTTADGGSAALEMCRAHRPDVVLLDMMMPVMDGMQVFEHLQADPATQQIPVILFTAKGRAGVWRSGSTDGIRGMIPKPYDPMTLGDQIVEILGWTDAD